MATTLPHYEMKSLDNGLKVVAIPMNNDTGVITVDLYYRVGSGDEKLGQSGLAHMLEHMNFKSTENMEAGEFDRIVRSLGGVTNASTGFDYTRYFIKSATHNLDRNLELFADMMATLSLKEEEFQPERDVVAEERRWRTDNNPMGYLFFTLFNTAYTYHPYQWTPIGFMEDILAWELSDLKAFHQTYYQPQNAILVVAGDLAPEALFEAAKAHFGPIENRAALPEWPRSEPEQIGPRRTEVYKESEVELVSLAWKIPAFDHEDIVPLEALSDLLSDGVSSRLQAKLVDEKQMVNGVNAFVMDLKAPGLFIILAVCNPGITAESVKAEILAELDAIKEKGLSEAELEKVRINARAEFIYAMESSDSLARLFGDYLAKGDLEPLLRYEQRLEALSREAIERVARQYLVDRTRTTVILRKGE